MNLDDLEKIFDSPRPAPRPERPFQPFPEPYLAGPVPDHLRNATVARLAALLTRLSEAEAAALVEFGSVWLDDRPCLNPDQPLVEARHFRLNPPAYGPVKFYEADPARIVYEDADLLVYNKESGRPSQAVPHDAYNNVLSALGRLLAGRGGASSLWLSHRLDADTSGLLLLARNKEAAGRLGLAFQRGQVAKEYLALGLGPEPDRAAFTVDAPIAKEGGRYLVRPGGPGLAARTDFSVLDRAPHPGRDDLTWVLFLAAPRTGRTHQIRLHLAWAGWPIAGDPFYGRREAPAPRLMLASAALGFRHPRTGADLRITLPGLGPMASFGSSS